MISVFVPVAESSQSLFTNAPLKNNLTVAPEMAALVLESYTTPAGSIKIASISKYSSQSVVNSISSTYRPLNFP